MVYCPKTSYSQNVLKHILVMEFFELENYLERRNGDHSEYISRSTLEKSLNSIHFVPRYL